MRLKAVIIDWLAPYAERLLSKKIELDRDRMISNREPFLLSNEDPFALTDPKGLRFDLNGHHHTGGWSAADVKRQFNLTDKDLEICHLNKKFVSPPEVMAAIEDTQYGYGNTFNG